MPNPAKEPIVVMTATVRRRAYRHTYRLNKRNRLEKWKKRYNIRLMTRYHELADDPTANRKPLLDRLYAPRNRRWEHYSDWRRQPKVAFALKNCVLRRKKALREQKWSEKAAMRLWRLKEKEIKAQLKIRLSEF